MASIATAWNHSTLKKILIHRVGIAEIELAKLDTQARDNGVFGEFPVNMPTNATIVDVRHWRGSQRGIYNIRQEQGKKSDPRSHNVFDIHCADHS